MHISFQMQDTSVSMSEYGVQIVHKIVKVFIGSATKM